MDKFLTVEQLFQLFDSTSKMLQEELDCTYLEALAESGENLFHGDVIQDELSEITKKRLAKQYAEINLDKYSREDIRKGYQLAILKGMQENVQPNHQMTPDSMGMFIGYLVGKLTKGQPSFSLLDPAVGTGNLLFTVINSLPDKKIQSYGSDVDEVLVKLSYIGANLMEHSVQFFNQDSLEPLFVDPVDIVVSDLPIGYYPNDIRANEYEIRAEEGHTFAHHLFIEQSVNHLKPGGYGVFLIPNNLFESSQSPLLHEYIKHHAYIQGIVQLPNSMFKSEAAAKSILIIQKKSIEVTQPKNALLVQLPKLSNQEAMTGILAKIDHWFVEEK
ncbi:class I SAM-dependent methyltransferase [Peribacillus acanthi]|uniref:class I SAM-dependent methyltransferase n=1 Tax=Peribacillus acanthi TaxID=2171554 RepID=UPI000D3EB7E2|nr:class I SAM-dependent methyltransferase [Peribacillus acanthi]